MTTTDPSAQNLSASDFDPRMPLPFDDRLASRVRSVSETLIPQQQPLQLSQKVGSDYTQQFMAKHPHLSEFTSYITYLHACLLEGDPTVLSYCPRPFSFRIGKTLHTPDCYLVRDSQRRQVIDLMPGGIPDDALHTPIRHYLARHGIVLVILATEDILARELEALNWGEIITVLHPARELITTHEEDQVWEKITRLGPCTLGNLIDTRHRDRTYLTEIAVFRLLHQGRLQAALTEHPLDFDTEFTR